MRSWLTDRGSLTARLQAIYPGFRVRLLRQGSARPNLDEMFALALLRRSLVIRREVLLMNQQAPLVFAHSVAPSQALRCGFRMLARQGGRPLGATLFADPKIHRGTLTYARLDKRHPLWRAAAQHIATLPPRLWARRSCFVRGRARLLVTEVFLPAIGATTP